MTDIIERAGKALEDYEKNKKEWRHGFAKELFATPALTLLPEAMKEIEELRDRAEAAEAKLATATEALKRVSRDMNWQANSGERLNVFVFDYIDAALAEIKG